MLGSPLHIEGRTTRITIHGTTGESVAIPTCGNGAKPKWLLITIDGPSATVRPVRASGGQGDFTADVPINQWCPLVLDVMGYDYLETDSSPGASVFSITPLENY